MCIASNLVHSLTEKRTPETDFLPSPLWVLFSGFHKAHRLWRFYTKAEIYSNPNNFTSLLAGHAIRIIFEDSLLVRIAAQTVLLATRILACIEEQSKVKDSFVEWTYALCGRYIHVKTRRFKRGLGLLSQLKSWQEEHLQPLIIRIQRIVLATMNLLSHLFQLSMKIMDAIEAFSLSPSTRNEGINEIFLSSSQWLTKLAENQDLLKEGLQDNAEIIQEILLGLGSSLDVKTLSEKIGSALSGGVTFCTKVENITKKVGTGVNYYARKELFQLMNALRLAKHIPRWLLPKTLTPPWAEKIRIDPNNRYPPKYLLTKPSYLKLCLSPKLDLAGRDREKLAIR